MRFLAPLFVCAALFLSSAASAQVFTVTPYGQGCGLVATGRVEPNGNTFRFFYNISNATPSTPVLLIVGVNETAVPINFGHNCLLLTELGFTQAHRTDANGSYTWSHALSAQFRGWARIQFAEATFDAQNNLVIRMTNGLYMQATT